MNRRTLSVVLILVCTALFWMQTQGAKLTFEQYKQERMADLRTSDEKLRSLYENQLEARYAAHYSDRDALKILFNTPGHPADTEYLVTALNKAYAEDPKDWATIASVLEIAVMGTDEESIIRLCIEILENAREIPNDGSDVVWGAAQYLLVKRNFQHVDVVIKCVYADHVGVEDDNRTLETAEEWRAGRDGLRSRAISALGSCLPTNQTLLDIFENLCRDHPIEGANPSSFRYSNAKHLSVQKKGIERTLNSDDSEFRSLRWP